jgi:hypothetical protein
MYRTRTILAFAAAAMLATTSLTACSAAEEVTEQAVESAQDIDIEEDGDSVTVTTEDDEGGDTETTVSTGDEAEVPDSFPDDFPLYDGTVTDSASMNAEDREVLSVTIASDDEVQSVEDYYGQALPDAGWEIVAHIDQGASNADYVAQKGDWQAEVSISSDSGGTEVAITAGTEY